MFPNLSIVQFCQKSIKEIFLLYSCHVISLLFVSCGNITVGVSQGDNRSAQIFTGCDLEFKLNLT